MAARVSVCALAAALLLALVLVAPSEGARKRTIDWSRVEIVDDAKAFKKLIRANKHVLVLAVKNDKAASHDLKYDLGEAAKESFDVSTVAAVDCSGQSGKKLCKSIKLSPKPLQLAYFQDGKFEKNYDRKLTASSLTNFLRDPTGDLPWSEDDAAADVLHLDDSSLESLLKSGKRALVFFYAPWCGHCKAAKPKFAQAAASAKTEGIDIALVGVDCDNPRAARARAKYDIKGFPTILLLSSNPSDTIKYEGARDTSAFLEFLRDPKPPAPPPPEIPWSDEAPEVMHLTDDTFDDAVASSSSLLVMFYAPWCGHCKNLKPDWKKVAGQLQSDGRSERLGAVDCTKETKTCQAYDVKGYPTIKFFKDGALGPEFSRQRTAKDILEFLADPEAPPPPPPPADIPWSEQDTDVLHLTADDFTETLKSKKRALVMFYAPWCGHCKAAKPKMESAAYIMRDDRKAAYAAVDCTLPVNTQLCSEREVKGYPTLQLFKYGKFQEAYTGKRETAEFVEVLGGSMEESKAKAATPEMKAEHKSWEEEDGPDSPVLHLNKDNFKTSIASKSLAMILFYSPGHTSNKETRRNYYMAASTAEYDRNVELAVVDCKSNLALCREHGIHSYPTIKIFNYGKPSGEYTGGRTHDALVTYIANHNLEFHPPKDRDEMTPEELEAMNREPEDIDKPRKDEL